MNDGEVNFDGLMLDIDRELTALKTAHKRPLGALDFFTKKQSITVNLSLEYGYYYADFWVDVTVETPEVTPPIVQVGWDVPANFNRIDMYEYSVNGDYSVWSFRLTLGSPTQSSATFDVTATSSLPIKSIQSRS